MTAAIATSREIKNKESGLDISVPEYREVTGMLRNYEEYHVIVITNLAYFKTIKTKQAQTVQFMVVKKYADFENLHKALSERFPATLFPDMPRKVFMVKDSKPQERRQCFDNLMRFVASSTKVCCSSHVLTFLGVKPERIHQVDEGNDDLEKEADAFDENESSTISPKRRSKMLSSGSQQSSLFSEEPEDEFDFFKADSSNVKETNAEDNEDDLFSSNTFTNPSVPTKKGKCCSGIRICVR